jgi:glycosyltransferase involved in cell wall biosynthesis
MKIAHVNDISSVSSTLVEGLRLLGHDAELFPLKLVGGKLPTWSKALLLPWRGQEMHAVNRHVRQGHFDIIHLHFAYLGWAGILGKYPYFLHCHGTDVRRNLNQFYQRPFVSRSLQRARMVFYSTPDLAEHVLPIRPDAIEFPHPINTQRFSPGDTSGNARQQRPRVLFISAISRIKGAERAFQVIRLLQELAPEIEIIVIGFGDRYQHYRQWPGITVLPRIPHEDMPALIRSCDVVVGQLHLGIMAVSETETMPCGKPVVMDYRYPEAYTEPPPLLTGETPEELVDLVIHLLNDTDERQNLGRRSREWIMKYHDYYHLARLLEAYYLEA